MPFLRDFDELVTQQQQTKQHEAEETDQQQQQTSSSLSERIKALETAGIIDSFVKKRVPPYAAAAAAVGSTLQQQSQIDSHHISETKQVTKIYRNPNPISTSNQQNNHLKTSSSTNLHSSSSRESLASNEVPPGALVSTLYRSASVDSIENELPIAANSGNHNSRRVSTIVGQNNQTQPAQRNGNNAELPSSFQSELVDRIKTLRKVSSSKDTNIHNQGEIPISIPLEPVNRISISSSASPSPAGLNGGLNKHTDSNSSSSLSSSINNNKPNEILPNNEDLYKTSFVIYPESNPPSSRVLRSHSPIGATLDFKIPIPAAATSSSATTTNKTIIHIDSQFMTTATTTTTTGASSPASSSCQYSSAANELLLPAASYAKSSGPYSSSCCLEEPLQAIQHHQHQHHHNHNHSNNRSQLVSVYRSIKDYFIYIYRLGNYMEKEIFESV